MYSRDFLNEDFLNCHCISKIQLERFIERKLHEQTQITGGDYMDIFGILSLIGGLALFLYGMNVMGGGLEKVSGGRLEQILEKLTSNPIKAVLLGAGVTAVIQSSSATTVMVV